jgi:hypothetical protein
LSNHRKRQMPEIPERQSRASISAFGIAPNASSAGFPSRSDPMTLAVGFIPCHYPHLYPVAFESQRDSIDQPRVASPRATLGRSSENGGNPERVVSASRQQRMQPRWGWRTSRRAPRVGARRANPGLIDAVPLGLFENTSRVATHESGAEIQPSLRDEWPIPNEVRGLKATATVRKSLRDDRHTAKVAVAHRAALLRAVFLWRR